MSTRKRGPESSLELLLDTICNTFGGVLFVAILIVVMLRMTSKSVAESDVSQVSEAEQMELEQQQAQLQAAIETLKRAGAGLEESPQIPESETVELAEQFKGKQKLRQALLQNRLETLDSIAKHQARVNQTARDLDELDEREKQLRKKQLDLESAIKTEVAVRTQKVEYSQSHSTGKQEIQTILRYGRFYVLHRHGPSGERLGLNTDDFIVVDDSSRETHATPMPNAGTTVADTPEANSRVKERLSHFKPRRDYVAVIVWPDSFEQFRTLKKAIIQQGFEYRLIPANRGDKFTDRGGTREGVQ